MTRKALSALLRHRYALVYAALAGWFVLNVGAFYRPHVGFTSMIRFGDYFLPKRLTRLDGVPVYTYRDSRGYDGQWYAQMAAAKSPLDPELGTALDIPLYRSRRMLVPVLAHLAGLGHPAWTLNAYALSGLVCWLILAWLLARWWFPPGDVNNLLRWAGTLFSGALIGSITQSLTDGPMLLAIAVGVRCVETGRQLLGGVALAAAGLVRETSVLAASALVPLGTTGRRPWLRSAAGALLCVAPPVLWALVVRAHYPSYAESANFGLPLAGMIWKIQVIAETWRSQGWWLVRDEILAIIALVTQVAFIWFRPRPRSPWWRVALVFSLLWLFLGSWVWDGWPSAVTRVTLPISLAFNVLVPRTRAAWILLVVGNLSILSVKTHALYRPPEQTIFGAGVTLDYGAGWYPAERKRWHTWRWASGPTATLTLDNPNDEPVTAWVECELRSQTARNIELSAGEHVQSSALAARQRTPVRFGPVTLAPGTNSLVITTDAPPALEPTATRRALAFALYDVYVTVARAPPRLGP
jgi:hypothetical protein